jgi:hypothetical protein
MNHKRQTFVVMFKSDDTTYRAFGTYRSFMAAEADAKAINHKGYAWVVPIEHPDEMP